MTVHYWPSNFWIEPDGTCVEVEYQIEKHAGHPFRQRIILQRFERTGRPADAKQLGRRFKLTPEELDDWNARRVDVMLALVGKKAADWPMEVTGPLLATGSGRIVEDNWWHDNFWGNCFCGKPSCRESGQNWLGETWEEIRRQAR